MKTISLVLCLILATIAAPLGAGAVAFAKADAGHAQHWSEGQAAPCHEDGQGGQGVSFAKDGHACCPQAIVFLPPPTFEGSAPLSRALPRPARQSFALQPLGPPPEKPPRS